MVIAGVAVDFPIRLKPWWLRLKNAENPVMLLGTLYVSDQELLERLVIAREGRGGFWDMALLVHEGAHAERQRQDGPWWWTLKYVLSRRFRYQEELLSYKAEARYLQSIGRTPAWADYARALSGSVYGELVSFEQAYADLRS